MERDNKPSEMSGDEFFARNENSPEKYFAVFGKPIAHSLSPLMQNAALGEIAKTDGAFAGAKYFAFEVDPDNLAETLHLFWRKNFTGINLTIPHKEIAFRILTDFDETAKKARACNTLLRTPDGWRGYNTDGFGVTAAVENAFGRGFENADVVLLGAGGAARGAAAAILGAKCKSLLVANRNPERLAKFADDMKTENFELSTTPLENVEAEIAPRSVIVNATAVGLKADDRPVIDFSKIPQDCVFLDMPYRRGAETSSVLASRANGIPAENGLAMLAWQGAKSLSIWTGKPLLGALMLYKLKEHLYGLG